MDSVTTDMFCVPIFVALSRPLWTIDTMAVSSPSGTHKFYSLTCTKQSFCPFGEIAPPFADKC